MILRALFLSLIIVSITSCSSSGKSARPERTSPKLQDPDAIDSGPSLQSKSRPKGQLYKVQPTKPLELPPDLISSTNDKVHENVSAHADSEERILPEVIGARIVKDGDKRWLEIDSNVETAWKAMTEFWSLSGIKLVDYNPEAGIMETEWVEEAIVVDEESSRARKLVKELFTAVTNKNTALDKFRLSFERVEQEQTIMRVSHRWIAKKEVSHKKKLSEFEWVELESDPSRVNDFLQNIVLLFDQSTSS